MNGGLVNLILTIVLGFSPSYAFRAASCLKPFLFPRNTCISRYSSLQSRVVSSQTHAVIDAHDSDSSDPTHTHSSADTKRLKERSMLKKQLFALCASCDRGFSATPKDRERIMAVINDLMLLTPETNPTRNFFPNIYADTVTAKRNDSDTDDTGTNTERNQIGEYEHAEEAVKMDEGDGEDDNEARFSHTGQPISRSPLDGAWKMIYTSAFDVLSLAANPLTTVQAIYQVLDGREGSAVNVIDVSPRLEALLPPELRGSGSTLRLQVIIDAVARRNQLNQVALEFKYLKIQPMSVLGFGVDALLPPLQLLLHQTLISRLVDTFAASADIRNDTTIDSAAAAGTAAAVSTRIGANKGTSGKRARVPSAAVVLRASRSSRLQRLAERAGPGFFEVLYLDEDCLVIEQGLPGGIFVSVRDTHYRACTGPAGVTSSEF